MSDSAPHQAKPHLMVDIWSDVMCPWCAIGYMQFAKSVKVLEGEMDISVRWMPFELNPGMAPEGKLRADHMADNYGSSPEEIEAMQANMREIGRRVGFSMDYSRLEGSGPEGEAAPEARIWNTFDAHRLLRWALAEQDQLADRGAQTRLKLALFRAHFQQRRNVGDREVLLDIAAAEGFDRGRAAEALEDEALSIAVRMEQQRGLDANINSVPSFVIEGQHLLPGAREPEVYTNVLRKIAAMAGEASK